MQHVRQSLTPGYMIATLIGMAVITLLLLAVLQDVVYLGGAPQAVTDAAMDRLVDVCNGNYGRRCQDFRTIRAQEKRLTATAQAQHAEAAWCVELQMKTPGGYSDVWDKQHLFIAVARTGEEFFVLDSEVLTVAAFSTEKSKPARDELWNSCMAR